MRKFDSRYILYFIVACAFIYIGYDTFRRNNALAACARYTLAAPKEIQCRGKNCNYLKYSFNYSNENITGTGGIGNDLANLSDPELLRKVYFVKFSCRDPRISEICWEIPPLDYMIDVPSNGWDEIPANFKTN